jgi:ABC-type transport system substrate-binding protein
MFNFKARDFFLAGFILGAIIVAAIILSILIFQSRSAAAEEPVPEEPTQVAEVPTEAPEEPTATPCVTRPIESDSLIGLHYILFNPTKPPVDDVNVRQALRYTIDRGRLAKIAIDRDPGLMNTYPTGTMAPKFMQPKGLQDELMRSYDPEKARALLGELLGEAFFDDGLTLVAAMPPGQESFLEDYRKMWAELGITLEEVAVPVQDVAIKMPSSAHIFLSPPQRLSTDPGNYYGPILSPIFELANTDELERMWPEVDGWLGQIQRNPESRDEAITNLESSLIEDEALIVPVFGFGPAECG